MDVKTYDGGGGGGVSDDMNDESVEDDDIGANEDGVDVKGAENDENEAEADI